MLDWLRRWFDQWTGTVGDAVVNMVHWAVRAVTGWAGQIFSAVGDAWADFFGAHGSLLSALEHFAWRVWRHLTAIVRRDFPQLWRWVLTAWRWLRRLISWVWAQARRLVLRLWKWTAAALRAVERWVVRDIWWPLRRYADLIWHDLLKWGYTAWWYITHPDKLAALIGWQLVSWLETNAWSAAAKLGGFFLALVTHNLRRVALLIEDLLHAAL